MKRNKYWLRDREYRKLLIAHEENSTAQSNLGYVELEKPVPYGYNAFFVLRADVARREDAWVFRHIIDLFGYEAWRRKNDFETVKERKKKRWEDKFFHDYPHWKSGIDEDLYLKQPGAVRKWLSEYIDDWGRKKYCHNIPNFYFEVKVVQNYKTHAKVMDNVLLQEEAEIKAKLYQFTDMRWSYRHGSAPKDYVRFWNVSDRRDAKIAIRKVVFEEKEDVYFPGRPRHSAKWAWW